jgi:CO/xanthine dehydrogenase Mo-binding subunit
VASAIYNALGIRFYSLPMSPPKISAALDAGVKQAAE